MKGQGDNKTRWKGDGLHNGHGQNMPIKKKRKCTLLKAPSRRVLSEKQLAKKILACGGSNDISGGAATRRACSTDIASVGSHVVTTGSIVIHFQSFDIARAG